MELTLNSNSSLGIGATTPTPIQRSGDDSNVSFESGEKVEKRCETGVTKGFSSETSVSVANASKKKKPANVKTITFKLPKLTTDIPIAYKASGHKN